MKTNKFNEVILTEQELFNGLYSGAITSFDGVWLDDDNIIKTVNDSILSNADNLALLSKLLEKDIQVSEFDISNQKQWFIPDNYFPNLTEYLHSKCSTAIQHDRVDYELSLFIQHGMYDVLVCIKYLVDFMRNHNIVWGVGRGSSVASYCLYLIGLHKIDSLKYNLDIKEFLKGE